MSRGGPVEPDRAPSVGPTVGVPPDTYTHGHHESVLRSHAWRTVANSASHLEPHLRPGQHVLDVGCGPRADQLHVATGGGDHVGEPAGGAHRSQS